MRTRQTAMSLPQRLAQGLPEILGKVASFTFLLRLRFCLSCYGGPMGHPPIYVYASNIAATCSSAAVIGWSGCRKTKMPPLARTIISSEWGNTAATSQW